MRADLSRPRRALAAAAGLMAAASVASVASVAALVASPQAAQAADSPKPPSLASLKADIARTSDRLAAATVAWERGQVRLGGLLQRKVSTQRSVEQLTLDARAAQLRVSSLANSLYRNPVNPALTAVLNGNIRSVNDLYYVRRTQEQTSADQRRDVTLLTGRAADTQSLLKSQDQAASEAIRLQSELDDSLARLQADALASQVRLQAAVAEIRRRQVEAAARAARAAGAFGAVGGFGGFGALGGGGPACAGPVPADAINGFLPDSALCPLRTAPGHRLIAGAAEAFDAMSTAFSAAMGKPMCITDSYRDYATQVSVFSRKPNLAATPGRSQHGWGRAVDLCGGVQQFGSPEFEWLKQNSMSFAFVHPDWAEPDGSRPEPWHWEFRG